jgi:hypothetical protein
MAKQYTKRNNAVIASQDATSAWSYANQSLKLYKIGQGFNYSVTFPNQSPKQVGSQEASFEEIFSQPDVNLTVSYIPEPNFSNEVRGRFIDTTSNWTSEFKNMFNTTDATNIYIFVGDDQAGDFLDNIEFYSSLNLNGDSALAFGNCYPTSYSLSYGVGSLPTVSTSYICSNMVFDQLTGTHMEMPAINLTGGNNDGVGLCDFTFAIDLTSAALEKKPVVVNPTDSNSSVTLENLQVGGQNLSGIHYIQSVDMSVNLPRVSSYGLGNDYAYDRKAQFPAEGSFDVSSLVSGMQSGAITGVLNNSEDYSFQLILASGSTKMIYEIEGAKLSSVNYGMSINGLMNFDASFTFKVTETEGLRLSGTYY